MTKISVIIPVFNSALTIERAINSVFSQTFSNIEIIVINDGSTDSSSLILKSYMNRIKKVNFDKNKGVSNARNHGMSIATGNYIAFLDSDDYWLPNKISTQLQFMIENRANASCSYVSYVTIDNNNDTKIKFIKKPIPLYDRKNFWVLCLENKIITSSVMIKKEVIPQAGFSNLRARQDLAFWVSLIKSGISFQAIPQQLTIYDLSSPGISSNKFKMIIANFKCFKLIFNSNIMAFIFINLNIIFNLKTRFIGFFKS